MLALGIMAVVPSIAAADLRQVQDAADQADAAHARSGVSLGEEQAAVWDVWNARGLAVAAGDFAAASAREGEARVALGVVTAKRAEVQQAYDDADAALTDAAREDGRIR